MVGAIKRILGFSRRGMRVLGRNERGTTALEFGIVALPFMMFLFGIINVGLLYFTTFTIENATEGAARAIRTGQAKTANWTQAQFKTQVCNRVPSFVNCSTKLRVDVQSFGAGATPSPTAGTNGGGGLKTDGESSYDNGALNGGAIVMVTTYYQWDLAKILPFLKFQGLSDGSKLLRATVAFKNEPF